MEQPEFLARWKGPFLNGRSSVPSPTDLDLLLVPSGDTTIDFLCSLILSAATYRDSIALFKLPLSMATVPWALRQEEKKGMLVKLFLQMMFITISEKPMLATPSMVLACVNITIVGFDVSTLSLPSCTTSTPGMHTMPRAIPVTKNCLILITVG